MVQEAVQGMINGCRLCPRECGADREHGKLGYCRMPGKPYAARAALHYWEEPCISGEEGRKLLAEIHARLSGHHAAAWALIRKAFRTGFYWPTARADA